MTGALRLGLLLILFGGAVAAGAEPLTGRASIIDGDTLRLAGERIRLHAIDAPERRQTCDGANGRAYPCGVAAGEELRAIIAGRAIICTPVDRDRWRRVVAICTVAGRDIADEMVLRGWARAAARYSDRYLAAETVARRARRGLWMGDFEDPWAWRRRQRSTP